jgi:2,4-dienoyl-CoA reductase-like NADH-dependent reductase (Old Yellow Enzyme family)
VSHDRILLTELKFRNLTVKNRVFRSNISGRFDNYDGSGSQNRINWEEKFARGGVGAICSSFVPVQLRGRIMPGYALIDRDEMIPFWRQVGETVHRHDCKFILQLSHSGRQRDFAGIENLNRKALSSTSRTESFHGFESEAMTRADIAETVEAFAQGARRAREAGLDGVELHGANGYLITQFLSSGINDRTDEYGGSVENRARFLLDIIRAIRRTVGDDFHLQVKISAVDDNNAVIPWDKPGNTLDETIAICRMIEQAGADAIHVSLGSMFPHPLNPPGGFPMPEVLQWYDGMLSNGTKTLRNYLMFRFRMLQPLARYLWTRHIRGRIPEGINRHEAKAIKNSVSIPVISTGGYQTASVIVDLIRNGYCDAVSMARPLVANNDLVRQFERGLDAPERPCTYCNKCLYNVLENPLGCYEASRFPGGHEEMVAQIMSVFHPGAFDGAAARSRPAAAE